jgi:hypothetical protein
MTSTFLGAGDAICAAVLITAGIMKLGNLRGFGQQIHAYQVVPKFAAGILGYVIPPIEIAVGVGMLFTKFLAAGAAILFTVFALVISLNLLRGRTELRCACFGAAGKHTISPLQATTDVALALLAASAFIGHTEVTLLSFQIGVSAFLLVVLATAWRIMKPIQQVEPWRRRQDS